MINPVSQPVSQDSHAPGGRAAHPGTRADHGLWLRRYHPVPGAAVRLVCCPHSGGSASYYQPLSAALSPTVEAIAVQYPGHQDRRAEPLVGDLRELAARLVEVLAEEPGPLALFGHSMGAMLAFEAARQLEAGGREIAALFVSSHRAPAVHRDEGLHRASDADLLHEVRRLSGTDLDLLDDDDIVQMVLPVIRNDTRAVETYRHDAANDPVLRCPITALMGTSDPRVTLTEADRWRAHTSGRFALHTFPGGHFYLNVHTAALGRLMSARLTGGLDE